MSERKPCPFCGSTDLEARHTPETMTPARVVKCWGCGAWGPYGSSNDAMAYEAWNTRTIDTSPDPC